MSDGQRGLHGNTVLVTYTVIGVIDVNINGIALKLGKWGA